MAKSSRSSVIKANNRRLKSNVFGPTETARTARLSEKLLELSRQPKPVQEEKDAAAMDVEQVADEERGRSGPVTAEPTKEAMDVDEPKATTTKPSKSRIEKKKVKSRKPGIVFPRFKDGPKNPKGKRVFRNQ